MLAAAAALGVAALARLRRRPGPSANWPTDARPIGQPGAAGPARPPDPAPQDEPARPPRAQREAGELWVAALLVAAGAAGVGTVVVYALGADTQLLGLTLGLALALLAAAAAVAGIRVLPGPSLTEDRNAPGQPAQEREVEELVAAEGAALTRGRLLAGAGGVAGLGLAAALITPLASLGPPVGDRIARTPWAAGVRLVGDDDLPIAAAAINVGAFLTAFPEGGDHRDLGAPVVVVRVDPALLDLPEERREWAHEGILAFSKICTHAACAVSLFRYPLFPAQTAAPALVCPCHYSTFDPTTGGRVTFGPAGRDLPQLPIAVDPNGFLVARSGFPDQIGPSYLRVRRPVEDV